MNKQYKFVSNFDDDVKPLQLPTVHFYQVCTFPNPKTKKYQLRRFTVNENNEFVDVKAGQIDETKYNQFIKTQHVNKYKPYSVYSIEDVSYPTLSDILLCRSDIMGHRDNNYSGFAQF